jgi:Tol biopolymer transport system component
VVSFVYSKRSGTDSMKGAVTRMIRRFAGLAAAILVCLGAGHASLAAAGPFSGPNGKLAVIRNSPESGNFLGSISPGGVFNPIYEEWDYNLAGAELSFSPDGSRIALNVGWRPSQLAIARTSGSNLRYVNTHRIEAYDPFWTADGRIIFTGQTLKGRRVGTYSIKPDGRDLRKLFGRVIFAASDRGQYVGASSSAFSHYLDLRDRRGKRINMLARSKRHFFVDPSFSPDGRWIVYERYLDPPGKAEHAGDRLGDIFVVRRDGTHRRRLTAKRRDMYPAFSPDGRWIAFVRHDRKTLASNVFALRVDRPGLVRKITNTRETYHYDLSWGRG